MGARDPIVELDVEQHRYRVGGIVVPGVTQVLRPLSDFSRIPPDVLAAKADLGRRVHLACEFDDDDDLDEATVEEDVAPYLAAYRRFRTETSCTVLANERRVYEPMHRYAGTLDRVLAFSGHRWLVDLKTSFTVPLAAGPQTAAYLRACNDPSITRRAALRLRPDGSYRLDLLQDADDWQAFFAALTLYRYQEKHQ